MLLRHRRAGFSASPLCAKSRARRVAPCAAKAAQGAHPELADRLWQAAETLREATLALLDRDMPGRFAGAVPYLNAFARVLGGHYHLRAALAGGTAHLALARVFMARVLPRNAGDLAEALAGSGDLTGIADEALAGDFAA